jgi:preprotein translocase subunit YajC
VVTGGGIIGTVSKVVNNDEVQVEIADNVRVRVVRSTITQVLARTEPVAAKDGKDAADNDAAPKEGEGTSGKVPPPGSEETPMWKKLLGLR